MATTAVIVYRQRMALLSGGTSTRFPNPNLFGMQSVYCGCGDSTGRAVDGER